MTNITRDNKQSMRKNYRLYFVCDNGKTYFTRRETECIMYLLDGKTAAEAAKYFDLSIRTIEYYINNMKAKMGCDSKRQMLACFLKADFTRFDMV